MTIQPSLTLNNSAHIPDGELIERISRIKWFHQIDLGRGIVTPGVDRSAKKLQELRLPERLTGKSFLDIGAWDGFFSFEAERRGAARVLATDSFTWQGKGWGSKAGFESARQILGSKIEDREIDVLELSPETVGTFDVVLFSGVLYHMRHPLLALERAASVTRELLIIETATDLLWHRSPAMAFYPGTERDGDQTNWWGPNIACIIGMLRCCAFTRIDVVSKTGLFRRLARAIRHASISNLRRGRVVIHARR
jgi:tRNA (mo5U34)-methyltransferase